MSIYYRGTQLRSIRGARKTLSFTPSLPVAVVWSSHPGNFWHGIKPHFLKTSTVHKAEINSEKQLTLPWNHCSLSDVLKALNYQDGGISDEEVRKIYQYLHNRLIGKTKYAGDFSYRLYDDEGEEVDDYEVPFSLRRPQTTISWYGIEQWDDDPCLETASRLWADTFIFVDAPAVQRAAKDQGYNSIAYIDVFAGGEPASEHLFGCPVWDLAGVDEDTDLEGDDVPVHWTVRPLDKRIIKILERVPAEEIVETTDLCEETSTNSTLASNARAGRKPKGEMQTILEAVREMHSDGATVSEISERLGVHKNTARSYLKLLGLTPRKAEIPLDPERAYTRARTLEIYEPGMNIHNLTYILDSDRNFITKVLKDEGVYVPSIKVYKSPSQMEKIYKLLVMLRRQERRAREVGYPYVDASVTSRLLMRLEEGV
jgi:transposase-like protein